MWHPAIPALHVPPQSLDTPTSWHRTIPALHVPPPRSIKNQLPITSSMCLSQATNPLQSLEKQTLIGREHVTRLVCRSQARYTGCEPITSSINNTLITGASLSITPTDLSQGLVPITGMDLLQSL